MASNNPTNPNDISQDAASITDDKVETPHYENASISDEDEEWKLTIGKLMAILSFQLGYMSDVFVLVMASSILTTINKDIGPNPNFTWVATAQVISAAVLAPMTGRLSDIFGRRNFLLVGNLIAMTGCAVAATAHSINTLIGASTLIGIGSAMHQLAWSCLAEIVPKKSRGYALGLFTASLAPASAFAPVVGYSFVIHSTWRSAYWLPFALDGAALVLVFLFYRPINQYIRHEGETVIQQIAALDWIGLFLLISGLVLFLLGISFGGNKFPWKSAGALAPLLIGFVLIVILGFYETFAKLEYPIFPRKIFANVRGFTVLLVGVFIMGMLYYSNAVLWPQQVQLLYTTNLLDVGWYSSAVGMAGSVFGPLSGFIFRKVGHARFLITVDIALLGLFVGLGAIVTPTSNIASTILTVFTGIFIAAGTVFTTTMIQLGVDHEFIGVATGLAILSRSVGGSVGTTIYTAVLQDRVKHYLVPDAAEPLIAAGVSVQNVQQALAALLVGDVTSPAVASLSPSQLGIAGQGIKEAYAHSFRIVYLVTIAFGVIGTICVAFSANVGHLMTSQVDIKLEEGAHTHIHNAVEKNAHPHGHVDENRIDEA